MSFTQQCLNRSLLFRAVTCVHKVLQSVYARGGTTQTCSQTLELLRCHAAKRDCTRAVGIITVYIPVVIVVNVVETFHHCFSAGILGTTAVAGRWTMPEHEILV